MKGKLDYLPMEPSISKFMGFNVWIECYKGNLGNYVKWNCGFVPLNKDELRDLQNYENNPEYYEEISCLEESYGF